MPDLDYPARFAALPDVMQMAVFALIYETADASQGEKRAATDFLNFMGSSPDLPEKTQRICRMTESLIVTVQAAAETGSAAFTTSSTDPTFQE